MLNEPIKKLRNIAKPPILTTGKSLIFLASGRSRNLRVNPIFLLIGTKSKVRQRVIQKGRARNMS